MIECMSRVVGSAHGRGGFCGGFLGRRRAGCIFNGDADLLQASLTYFVLTIGALVDAEGEACLALMASRGWLCCGGYPSGLLSGTGL